MGIYIAFLVGLEVVAFLAVERRLVRMMVAKAVIALWTIIAMTTVFSTLYITTTDQVYQFFYDRPEVGETPEWAGFFGSLLVWWMVAVLIIALGVGFYRTSVRDRKSEISLAKRKIAIEERRKAREARFLPAPPLVSMKVR